MGSRTPHEAALEPCGRVRPLRYPWLHRQGSADQRGSVRGTLIERAEQATRYPDKHRKVPELDRDDVREVFEGQYRIIFQVHAHEVEVIAVLHGSRLLRDLTL
ncbi:MAG: type II toxin-antitoxin system RelE/ParE family toxin [Rhodanobacteraceae bacterium]|nr:type II toxin-antitoxin system RelE/ParE family toxin [Rhodanobacteraceae bacterium]